MTTKHASPRALTVLATLALTALATPVLAQSQNCTGRDLLAELKTSDAALYEGLRKTADETPNGRNVLWKIERHSGRPVEITERQRRHPFLFAWPVLFRLLRERVLR